MPRPSVAKYDELNGEEVKAILEQRYKTVLNDIPYLQRHLTLPRVRISMSILIEVYADQPTPEVLPIHDQFDIITDVKLGTDRPVKIEIEDSVSSAPRGGQPADQVREEHGLPVMRATPVRDSRGEHVVIVDSPDGGQQHVQVDAQGKNPYYQFAKPTENVEGAVVIGIGGTKIDRTGSEAASEAGRPTTRATIDQGRAGLREGQMNRSSFNLNGRSPRDR